MLPNNYLYRLHYNQKRLRVEMKQQSKRAKRMNKVDGRSQKEQVRFAPAIRSPKIEIGHL